MIEKSPVRQKFFLFSLPLPNAQTKYMISLTHGIARTINVISHSPIVMTALLGSVIIVLFSILICNARIETGVLRPIAAGEMGCSEGCREKPLLTEGLQPG